METGQKVVVANKDGTTYDAEFVSSKAGWTVIKTKDGEKKTRSNLVTAKLSKADIKRAEVAARKAEKAAKAAKEPIDNIGKLVPADLSRYVLHDTKTASGRKKIDINDETAEKLRELDLDGTYKYAASILDENVKELKAKYANLNPGMQRMNLGNRVRKAFRLAAEVSGEVVQMKKAA